MEGERRLLTILFCDVAGSTALAEQLDPEEWAEIMSSAFRYLIEPVLRYEGTLSRLMGDAILAYFGAPAAHEDDPQRAVLAALDIHSGLESFRREIAQDYGLDFNVRTGIHTGPVVMLEVGAGEAAEYTAMGDAVNLAARIEQSADPGTIRISEDTHRLIAPLFECEPLGTVEVKGKREPVPVYRVLGRKDPASRRGPGCELSPFTGRQAELQRLQEALDRLLRTGQGGLVFIRGEAGLGKSRLIEELRQRITEAAGPEEPGAAPQVAWVESRAVSYDTQRPYGLFLHLLRQACGVDQNDPPEVMQSKIMQAIDQNSSAQDEDHRRHMRRAVEMLLLSANQRTSQDPVLEGEALKREIFSVVQQSVRMSASQHALVLVIEDMHWLDPASTGLLEELFLLAEELPILYLCALRPLYVSPGWHALEYARRRCARMLQEIELQPLPAGETQALLDSLVQDSEISPGLRKALLQRAEGNPLFLEELVREYSLDSGGSSGLRSLPDNLHTLLTSRIDRLEPAARRLLQLAAVAGRTFHPDLLARVSDDPGPVPAILEELQNLGLLRRAEEAGPGKLAFQHELLREAAYESILHRQRRSDHLRVGEALESMPGPPVKDIAHRLAHHFLEGGDDERALKYAVLAGENAARLFVVSEASSFFARAIEVARRMPAEKVSEAQLRELYQQRGRALELDGQFDAAMENYRELESLARQRSSLSLELAALTSQAIVHVIPSVQFDPWRSQEIAARIQDLLQQVHDPALEARALWTLGLLESRIGLNNERALEYGQQAEAIARRHDLKEQLAYTLHDLSRTYMEVGRIEDAWEAHEESKALWRELGNLPMLADSLGTGAQGLYLMGRYQPGIELSEEGIRVSRQAASLWGEAYCLMGLGHIYLETGEIEKSLQALDRAQKLGEQANFLAPVFSARVLLAWVYAQLGDPMRGLEIMEQVRRDSRTRVADAGYISAVNSVLYLYADNLARVEKAFAQIASAEEASSRADAFFGPLFTYFRAELAFRRGDYQNALDLAQMGLEERRQSHARIFLVDYYELQGRALLELGRLQEARRAFEKAHQECLETGSRRLLWKVLFGQARACTALGDEQGAQALRREASGEVRRLSASIGRPDLKQAFEQIPEVRELLSTAA